MSPSFYGSNDRIWISITQSFQECDPVQLYTGLILEKQNKKNTVIKGWVFFLKLHNNLYACMFLDWYMSEKTVGELDMEGWSLIVALEYHDISFHGPQNVIYI